VGPEPKFPFFVAIDFENLDKLEMFREDAQAIKSNRKWSSPTRPNALNWSTKPSPGKTPSIRDLPGVVVRGFSRVARSRY